jgi:predicted RNA binding protein YcfA (HicA-like mRNA interferase family)
MPHGNKIPVCSGRRIVKALKKIGYEIKSQRGSHIKLVRYYGKDKHIIVVPLHREMDRGTLAGIIRRVSQHYPEEEFLKILKEIC